MKTVDFSETIAACDRKVGRCRQLIEIMKVMSIEGQGHFFTIYFPGSVFFVLYYAKISGERLQDHWSSGFVGGVCRLELEFRLNTSRHSGYPLPPHIVFLSFFATFKITP